MSKYADIIIDFSHEKLDKTFQYIVPDNMQDIIKVGMEVEVSFGKGKRTISGYVINLTDKASYDEEKLKEISKIVENKVDIESQLIKLAYFIKETYGSTMIQALKTVLPVKKKIASKQKKYIVSNVSNEELKEKLDLYKKKHNVARVRLLEELISEKVLDYELVSRKLNISSQTINGLTKLGIIKIESEILYRNPVKNNEKSTFDTVLNQTQQQIADDIYNDDNNYEAYLIHGVTGSGKTEIYMELIDRAAKEGRQSIVLIPEIALTYQTVKRFYKRFGSRVSIMNSRLSQGEKYDQFERAKNGQIDVIIGPRSALFTPFTNLGYIIIDEEHEGTYKSETVPRYHAREVAIERARYTNAKVVLGSATPSVDSYYAAMQNRYKLYKISKRAVATCMADVELVDLREELRNGNRSILSERLQELIEDRLNKHEQIMLFINRRGYESFVSCRSCGHVIKCEHCDVALNEHNNGMLVCHYCGYTKKFINKCPECGSKYIGGFKAGTQKIEMLVQNRFKNARILRMDMDTTRTKDGHEKILSAFADHEADILIGTQMIVKGHDFSNVTLVGVLAADLSLYSSDFMSSERTFQLLTQAAGRAGRGSIKGNVVIQTYNPDNFSILAAKDQDYEKFYEQEIAYRSLMNYPPVYNMMLIIITSKDEDDAINMANNIKDKLDGINSDNSMLIIGPAFGAISKIKDTYKLMIYLKCEEKNKLIETKNELEIYIKDKNINKDTNIIFDLNPMNIF